MLRNFGVMAVVLGFALSAFMAADSFAAGGRPSGGGRPNGGSKPAFSSLLASFDKNGDSALAQSEVPANVWNRLKAADSNGDKKITQAEYDGYGRP